MVAATLELEDVFIINRGLNVWCVQILMSKWATIVCSSTNQPPFFQIKIILIKKISVQLKEMGLICHKPISTAKSYKFYGNICSKNTHNLME